MIITKVPPDRILKRRFQLSYEEWWAKVKEEDMAKIQYVRRRPGVKHNVGNGRQQQTDKEILDDIKEAVKGQCPEAYQIAMGYKILNRLTNNPKARREGVAIIKRAENKQFAYGKRMRGIRG